MKFFIANRLRDLHRALYRLDREKPIVLFGSALDEFVNQKQSSYMNYWSFCKQYSEIATLIDKNMTLVEETAEG